MTQWYNTDFLQIYNIDNMNILHVLWKHNSFPCVQGIFLLEYVNIHDKHFNMPR